MEAFCLGKNKESSAEYKSTFLIWPATGGVLTAGR
jgi:hypothetical protein